MGERHSAYIIGNLISKYGNGSSRRETGVEFTGGRDAWTVQVDGKIPTRHLATGSEIIAEDLSASIEHGKPSDMFGTRGTPNTQTIKGAAGYIAGFEPGARAAKLPFSDGTTHIVPRIRK